VRRLPSLNRIAAALRRQHGAQRAIPKTAFEWVLWGNCSYLAKGDRRAAAFALLRTSIGLDAKAIERAPRSKLLDVTRHGIVPELFADKLRSCAEIALGDFDGDVDANLSPDPAKAARQLQKFPGIGAPGAERILSAVGRLRTLAVESNGTRVLKRIGFAPGTFKTWIAEYRAVVASVPTRRSTSKQVFQATLLLQQHGRTLCRASRPQCGACKLRPMCAFGVNAY
jgi:endonuclease III